MVITFTFPELIKLIKKRIVFIFLVTLICLIAGFSYSKYFFSAESRVNLTLNFRTSSQVVQKTDLIRYQLLERDQWVKKALTTAALPNDNHNINYVQSRIVLEHSGDQQARLKVQFPCPLEAKRIATSLAQVIQEQEPQVKIINKFSMGLIPSPWKRITILSCFFGLLLGLFLATILEIYYLRFNSQQMLQLLQEKRIHVRRVTPTYFIVKRFFDVILGCVGLMFFLLTYFFLIIPYNFGENKGPILFRQKRYGFFGTTFSIYKFRSMKLNAEEILLAQPDLYQKYLANDYKLPADQDPRITKLGAFLRKTSLDELPQFINVIKGEMSLVGPRPIITEEIKEYGNLSDLFFSMKPGITGVWGANGRSSISYPERKNLELSYLEERSLMFDLKIIFKTIFKVLQKDGAY